ncbi:VWA domain-containing protein [Paracidobacterium acidisoli]|uniref:VWA domain-containing protein n=1 Tax=Paracidobacterium acidisoli TaxID=2303751 RepID=A0A372IKF3_9BACT|nr:VWA domain-containing protein [Paracidobacterium acidisoli]MBT9332765.1 VWA domain-containing protein [Paracidobacterium acidisoli]
MLTPALLAAQTPGAAHPAAAPPASSAQSAQTQTAPSQPKETPAPEAQQPLNVDRDPVLGPDRGDNETISPGNTESAQPEKPQEIVKQQGTYTLRRDVEEVVLNCTVVDKDGHLVNDLTKDDFHVWEDNTPQVMLSFQHQDIPVSMGILVDNSGSMRDKRAAVNTAALDLVRASNPDDEAFIVNFSDEAFIDQDFTSNINKLREGLSHIDSKGGTALYDAVIASADELAKHAKRPKQVLLIITDGEDNASVLTLEQTIRRIQNLQGPVVYSIGLLFGEDSGGRTSHRARRALEMLSTETGGIAYFPHSLSEVDSITAEVARDIRNQYTIGYRSTKPPSLGGYRVVRVDAKAANHGKLTIRTRTGYFPKPDAAGAAAKTPPVQHP